MKDINVARLTEGAKLPTRKHSSDAGLDFYSNQETSILPGESMVLGTGIVVEIPDGFFGLLMPKSKSDWVLGAGVIDSGYRGEIKFKIINPLLHEVMKVDRGDAIGQMIITPVLRPGITVVELSELTETQRGTSGGIHD